MDKSGIPASSLGQVEAAIAKAQRKGVSKAGTQAILSAVAKQYQSNRPPRDAGYRPLKHHRPRVFGHAA